MGHFINRRRLLGATAALAGLMATPTLAAPPKPYAWTVVPYGAGGYVDGFIYHPNEKGLLYARTDIGGLYRYDYPTKTWIALLDHLGHADADLMGVLSIALDPSDPNAVYVACGLYLPDWGRKGAILRSHDRGATWTKTELPIHVGGNSDGRGTGERLVVSPRDAKTLYYASNQDGLWVSHDGGATFATTASPAKSLSMLAFDPTGGDLYAGSAEGKGGLFVSHAGGAFEAVKGPPEQVPQRAAFARDGTLYVTFAQGNGAQGNGSQTVNPSGAVRGGLWRRNPDGQWRNVSPIITGEQNVFGYSGVDAGPDGTLVVSTLDRWWPQDDLFVSHDRGATWTALSQQARFEASAWPWLAETNTGRKMGSWISDLKINPFNADELIYGHGGGLWMSRNLTAAGKPQPVWFDANLAGFEEGAVTQTISPTGGATLMAAMGDMSGGAWDDLTKSPAAGLFRPNTESNLSVDFAGQNPGFIVRTVVNSGTHGFYSTDAGASWTLFPASPFKPAAQGQPWKSPGILAVSARATSLLWAPGSDQAAFSSDRGKTWTASAGWPTGPGLIPIADKVADSVFYVHDSSGGRVLVSVDGGATFKPIVSGLPAAATWDRSQLAVVPTRMRDLWLALPGGLLHSRDANAAMGAVRGVDTAWAIGFGAPAVKDGYPAVYLYGVVRGQEGLWRSDDEGATWVRINDDRHQFGDMHAITGDPLEYGTVYIAPHGRGILAGRP